MKIFVIIKYDSKYVILFINVEKKFSDGLIMHQTETNLASHKGGFPLVKFCLKGKE